jgi:hypothetical protein
MSEFVYTVKDGAGRRKGLGPLEVSGLSMGVVTDGGTVRAVTGTLGCVWLVQQGVDDEVLGSNQL